MIQGVRDLELQQATSVKFNSERAIAYPVGQRNFGLAKATSGEKFAARRPSCAGLQQQQQQRDEMAKEAAPFPGQCAQEPSCGEVIKPSFLKAAPASYVQLLPRVDVIKPKFLKGSSLNLLPEDSSEGDYSKLPPLVAQLCAVTDIMWEVEIDEIGPHIRPARNFVHRGDLPLQQPVSGKGRGGPQRDPGGVIISRDLMLRTRAVMLPTGSTTYDCLTPKAMLLNQKQGTPKNRPLVKGPQGASTASSQSSAEGGSICAAAALTSELLQETSDDIAQAYVDDDDESVCSEASDLDDPINVIVGPTNMAVAPFTLEQLWLRTVSKGPCPLGFGSATPQLVKVMLRSSPRQLSLSDALRLSEARSLQAPLSFGSVLHICQGDKAPCRPCMFERWAGRCSKKWLCDFCHLHTGQKQRRRDAGGINSKTSDFRSAGSSGVNSVSRSELLSQGSA